MARGETGPDLFGWITIIGDPIQIGPRCTNCPGKVRMGLAKCGERGRQMRRDHGIFWRYRKAGRPVAKAVNAVTNLGHAVAGQCA